jgi:hypothetical protein
MTNTIANRNKIYCKIPTRREILQKKVVSVGEHCVMAPVCAMMPELASMLLELELELVRPPRAPLNFSCVCLFMLF